jgi:hypothetical protein
MAFKFVQIHLFRFDSIRIDAIKSDSIYLDLIWFHLIWYDFILFHFISFHFVVLYFFSFYFISWSSVVKNDHNEHAAHCCGKAMDWTIWLSIPLFQFCSNIIWMLFVCNWSQHVNRSEWTRLDNSISLHIGSNHICRPRIIIREPTTESQNPKVNKWELKVRKSGKKKSESKEQWDIIELTTKHW